MRTMCRWRWRRSRSDLGHRHIPSNRSASYITGGSYPMFGSAQMSIIRSASRACRPSSPARSRLKGAGCFPATINAIKSRRRQLLNPGGVPRGTDGLWPRRREARESSAAPATSSSPKPSGSSSGGRHRPVAGADGDPGPSRRQRRCALVACDLWVRGGGAEHGSDSGTSALIASARRLRSRRSRK